MPLFSSFAYHVSRISFNDYPIPLDVFFFQERMHFLESLFRYPPDTINAGRSSIIKSRQWSEFLYHLKYCQFRMRFLRNRDSHIQCFF